MINPKHKNIKLDESFFLWKQEYMTGIVAVDTQHKKLFQIMSDLFQTIKNNDLSSKIVEQTLHQMVDYAEFHFKQEEELFRIYSYTASDDHIQKHHDFRNTVQNLINQHDTSEIMKSIILIALKDWWVHHIMVEDMAYVPFIKSKGQKIGLTVVND